MHIFFVTYQCLIIVKFQVVELKIFVQELFPKFCLPLPANLIALPVWAGLSCLLW